jgi:hypothetical protein
MTSMMQGVRCPTLTEAYRRLGIDVTAPRNASWSMRSDDRVVLVLWADEFDPQRRVYSNFQRAPQSWSHKRLNRRRIEHLKHVQSLRDPMFESIVATPVGRNRHSRKIWEIGPTMRLTNLDAQTGQFSAETVN